MAVPSSGQAATCCGKGILQRIPAGRDTKTNSDGLRGGGPLSISCLWGDMPMDLMRKIKILFLIQIIDEFQDS